MILVSFLRQAGILLHSQESNYKWINQHGTSSIKYIYNRKTEEK